MANPNPRKNIHKENLRPVRTKEEARERGRNGGIKSGKVRREKKLLSEIYAEVLADENNINGTDKSLKEIIGDVLTGIFSTPAAKVSMLKEIREATEGNKLNVTGDIIIKPAPGLKKRTLKNDTNL